MLLAIAHVLHIALLVPRRCKAEVRAQIEVRVLLGHQSVTAAIHLGEGVVDHRLAIHVQVRRSPAAQQQQVAALRQCYESGGTHEAGIRAVAAHPGVHILFRKLEQAKGILLITLRHLGRLRRPGIRSGHAFFTDLHQHLALGQLRALHRRWRRHKREGVEQFVLRFATVDGEIVDPAVERMRGGARGARADHHRVTIRHWRTVRGPAHVPHAVHGLAVNVAFDALGFAEGVSHCDVMPARARIKAVLRPPAMPVALLARHLGAREQKADQGLALLALQAQGVVLIVRAELLRAVAPLAHDVGRGAVLQLPRLHPGLQRDRVVQAKAQVIGALHLQRQLGAVAGEQRRLVVLGKGGVHRRTRTRLVLRRRPGPGAQAVAAFEIPRRHRLQQSVVGSGVVAARIVLGNHQGGQGGGGEEEQESCHDAQEC